jgi:hypothetical protein
MSDKTDGHANGRECAMICLRGFVLAARKREPGNGISPQQHHESDLGRECSSLCIKGNHIAIYPLPTRRSSSERPPVPSKSSIALLLGPASAQGNLFQNSMLLRTTLSPPKRHQPMEGNRRYRLVPVQLCNLFKAITLPQTRSAKYVQGR